MSASGLPGRLRERLALVALIAAGSALACRWALDVDNWRVMTDELFYVKAAEAVGESWSPILSYRGEPVFNYGVLYPTLLAPFAAVLDFPLFFRVVHLLGAVMLVSTALPTYFVTRYVSRSRLAALAAAVPVAVAPWILFSLNLMTEALAAPLFAWAFYAFVRAVAEPSPRRDLLAMVAGASLILTRTQFIFMPVVLVLAVILHEVGIRLGGGSPRRWPGQLAAGIKAAVTRHPVFMLATASVAIGLTVVTSTTALVGDYSVVVNSGLLPPGLSQSLADHVTIVAFSVAAVPLILALAFVADALWARDDARVHALAVCLLLTGGAAFAVAASFDLRFASVVQERYAFYAAPLLMVGAACFASGARRPVRTVILAAIAGALVITASKGLLPVGDTSVFASPARQGWIPLNGNVYRVGNLVGLELDPKYALALWAAAAALGVAWLVRVRRRTLALAAFALAVSVWTLGLTLYAGPRVLAEHENLATVGLGGNVPLAQRGWVDHVVGENADVGIAPAPIASRDGQPTPVGGVESYAVWWEAEFRNRSVGSSFVLIEAGDYTPYSQNPMTIDRASGKLDVDGQEAPFLVVARGTQLYGIAGTEIAQTRDLRLIRPQRPYRAAWSTARLGDLGTLRPGRPAALAVYGPASGPPRRVRVTALLVGRTMGLPLTVRSGGSAESLRVFGRRRVERSFCVPADSARRLGLTGPSKSTLRLIQVDVRMGPPC